MDYNERRAANNGQAKDFPHYWKFLVTALLLGSIILLGLHPMLEWIFPETHDSIAMVDVRQNRDKYRTYVWLAYVPAAVALGFWYHKIYSLADYVKQYCRYACNLRVTVDTTSPQGIDHSDGLQMFTRGDNHLQELKSAVLSTSIKIDPVSYSLPGQASVLPLSLDTNETPAPVLLSASTQVPEDSRSSQSIPIPGAGTCDIVQQKTLATAAPIETAPKSNSTTTIPHHAACNIIQPKTLATIIPSASTCEVSIPPGVQEELSDSLNRIESLSHGIQRSEALRRELTAENKSLREQLFEIVSEWVIIRIRGKDSDALDTTSHKVLGTNQRELRVIQKSSDQGPTTSFSKPASRRHMFDRVFSGSDTTGDIFAYIKPMIFTCLQDHAVTLIADGQTGTGKSHTFFNGPNALTPSALVLLLDGLGSLSLQGFHWTIHCSVAKYYMGSVFDLLAIARKPIALTKDLGCKHRTWKSDAFEEESITSLEDILGVLARAAANKKVGVTAKNPVSSRGHTRLRFSLRRWQDGQDPVETELYIFDLAGSEREDALPTGVTGKQSDNVKSEQVHNNKVRSDLRDVIRNRKEPAVDWKKNEFTKLASPAIKPTTKLLYIGHVSPLEADLGPTADTITFGQKIQSKARSEARQASTTAPRAGLGTSAISTRPSLVSLRA